MHAGFAQKNWGNLSQGSTKCHQNMCCVFFCHLYNVASWTLVLHWFRPYLKQQAWISVPECTPVRNCQISEYRCCKPQKTALGSDRKWYFGWGACYLCTAQTAQFRATGIILRASRHPKDVPFGWECWWGMYSLGVNTPLQIKGIPWWTPYHFW